MTPQPLTTTATDTDGPLRCQLDAVCETAAVDFKAGLDVDNKGEWLEILKDIVAMANSGGGVILFGLDGAGSPTGSNIAPLLNYDVSRVGDKLRKYTGVNLGGVSLLAADPAFIAKLRERHHQWVTERHARETQTTPPAPVDWAYRRR